MNTANFATLKALAAKATLALTAAAALIFAVPAQSQAQEFARARAPFAHPYFARPGFDRLAFARREDLRRREQFERRDAFFRHQQWDRTHRFYR
jgi:quinol monooxygenase YgiN